MPTFRRSRFRAWPGLNFEPSRPQAKSSSLPFFKRRKLRPTSLFPPSALHPHFNIPQQEKFSSFLFFPFPKSRRVSPPLIFGSFFFPSGHGSLFSFSALTAPPCLYLKKTFFVLCTGFFFLSFFLRRMSPTGRSSWTPASEDASFYALPYLSPFPVFFQFFPLRLSPTPKSVFFLPPAGALPRPPGSKVLSFYPHIPARAIRPSEPACCFSRLMQLSSISPVVGAVSPPAFCTCGPKPRSFPDPLTASDSCLQSGNGVDDCRLQSDVTISLGPHVTFLFFPTFAVLHLKGATSPQLPYPCRRRRSARPMGRPSLLFLPLRVFFLAFSMPLGQASALAEEVLLYLGLSPRFFAFWPRDTVNTAILRDPEDCRKHPLPFSPSIQHRCLFCRLR